jgi:hypothetical protein
LDIANSDNLLASLKQPGKAAIIDVDAFEYEDILKRPKMSAAACEGYTINFPGGKSPHTAYPFALHDTIILPWDYALKNGVMKLFARSCHGLSGESGVACQPCRQLVKNEMLGSILTRMEDVAHENVGFAYHGFSGLQEILRRKNQLLNRVLLTAWVEPGQEAPRKSGRTLRPEATLDGYCKWEGQPGGSPDQHWSPSKEGGPWVVGFVYGGSRGVLQPEEFYGGGGYEGVAPLQIGRE